MIALVYAEHAQKNRETWLGAFLRNQPPDTSSRATEWVDSE